MTRWILLAATTALFVTTGCSKHDCDLSSEADKKKFGEVAEMTGGAMHCMVSNSELVATHPDKSVDEIAESYKSFLEGKSWKVEVKDHEGKRANGKPLKGKVLVAENGGAKTTTLVYPLTDGITETVTSAN